jgi:hypothetical protein
LISTGATASSVARMVSRIIYRMVSRVRRVHDEPVLQLT